MKSPSFSIKSILASLFSLFFFVSFSAFATTTTLPAAGAKSAGTPVVASCAVDLNAAIPVKGCSSDGAFSFYDIKGGDDDIKFTVKMKRVDGNYILTHLPTIRPADEKRLKCGELFCRLPGTGDIVGLHHGWKQQQDILRSQAMKSASAAPAKKQ